MNRHEGPSSTSVQDLAEIVRQLAAHYGLWFAESVHQLGLERALDAEQESGDRLLEILMGKLERALGREFGQIADVSPEVMDKLGMALRSSWLATDGVWFQAVERRSGMDAAKRVNDTCWSRFSPLEARRAKALLGLPDSGGIEALKKALAFRMYARLNTWEFVEETGGAIVFRMKECRVQSARKRKGLDDYPCKSGGITEYSCFAHEIDPRLRCECIGCPPDAHPESWVCSWKFTIDAA